MSVFVCIAILGHSYLIQLLRDPLNLLTDPQELLEPSSGILGYPSMTC